MRVCVGKQMDGRMCSQQEDASVGADATSTLASLCNGRVFSTAATDRKSVCVAKLVG